MEYKIGQVLWLVMNSTKSVTPVQVVSKLTQENLEGVSIQHVVHDTSGAKHCIEKVKGHVFQSADSAKEHLMETAGLLIKNLIENAKEAAKAFNPGENQPPVDRAVPVSGLDLDDRPLVELPDGTMARVTIPEVLK